MKLNTAEVADLQPDYLGFIFWEPSKRYFQGMIPPIPHRIKKVGVFVDTEIEQIVQMVATHDLLLVQLHGQESPAFCEALKKRLATVKIIKAFAINEAFEFGTLQPFEAVCDYFLFDTKGELPGGNGSLFNWNILKENPSTKPYFLSGGIGLEAIESINEFKQLATSHYCHAIDVNSKFEVEPGLKDIEKLKEFTTRLSFGH